MKFKFPPDISQRIIQEYNEKFNFVEELLTNLYFFHDAEEFKLRLIRAVVFLSNGNIERLEYYINQANTDYRDIFYWAEYDQADKQIRDFTKPFNNI